MTHAAPSSATLPRIIIGVLSAREYQSRRDGIMATWGKDAAIHPEVDIVFLIGDPQLQAPRREGINLYLPCPDDYDCLPQKTRWFCLWALAIHGEWERLFKCDDDTYVHVGRLLAAEWIEPIVGCKDGNGDHFHGGAGYLISRFAAMAIAAHLTAAKGLEDWKARDAIAHCGMWFEHDGRLCFNKERLPAPSNEQITCHYASPVRMRLLHDAFRLVPADAQIMIPRIIHHVWLGSVPVPDHLASLRKTWLDQHPAWDMRLWTEDSLPPLVNQRAFDQAATQAQKCHIARYEILHTHGGIYVDFDVECRRPIDELLYGVSGFAAAEDDDTVGIAVMGAVPGDPMLSHVIAALPQAFASGTNPPNQTGAWFFTPYMLADCTWQLLWWDKFYPRHYSGRTVAPIEYAYGIHHWEASWKR